MKQFPLNGARFPFGFDFFGPIGQRLLALVNGDGSFSGVSVPSAKIGDGVICQTDLPTLQVTSTRGPSYGLRTSSYPLQKKLKQTCSYV